jgi:multidrug efflux pump subunit AcrA (membrane-fusion protein)
MKQKKITTAIIVVIIVAAFVLYAVNSAQKIATSGSPGTGKPAAAMGPPGRDNPDGSAQGDSITTVRAVTAAIQTLKPYIDESGDVEANVNVSVYPDIGGKLVTFTIAIGDSVEKGQTIARIDPSKPGSNYAISPVVAPITGTVTAIDVDQGSTVSTATAIASVGIIDDLKIVVNLPERDSDKAEKGMTAVVTFEALPDENFSAVVTRVSPVLDPTSRSREITLGFHKHDLRISSGMYAKIRLYTTPLTGKIVIPSLAIVTKKNAKSVFIITEKDGKDVAAKRDVKTGTEVDGSIIIMEGLSVGDKVIYEGQNGLSDGSAVTILSEAKK